MALTKFAVLRDSLQTTRFSTLASLIVLLYDQALTFDDENRYASIASLGFSTTVLFQGQLPPSLQRYAPWEASLKVFPMQISLLQTRLINTPILVLLSGHFNLGIEIYALYDRNKRVLVFVILLFIADKAVQFVFVYGATHHSKDNAVLYKAWVIYRRGDRYPLLIVILRDTFLLVATLNFYFRVFAASGASEYANGCLT
ncbi:hypothetical protein BU17DRAFT_64112 [Hysterangium stoloniferum]|nr:hypothetical protein BU17DRAFT_64112 [Hysterangium stoloniferum]